MKERGPRHWRFLWALGVLAMALSPGCGRDDPADLEHRARANRAAGRLEDAEANLVRLARIRPLTASERLLRAQVAQDQGRIDLALAMLDEPSEAKQGPDAALLAARRGSLEMQRSRFCAAEAQLTRALTLDPRRAEARCRLIDLYALQGRSADIATQVRELGRVGPLDFPYLYAWTLGRREGLDPAERAQLLERAIQADPEDRTSRLALAECLRRLGRLDQASSALEPLPQTDLEARIARARIALDQGETASAEDLLGPGSGASTDDAPALASFRGRLALIRGDAQAAAVQFRLALKAAPEDRDAQAGLGQALLLTGDPKTARPYTQAAHDHDHLEWLVQSARPGRRRNDPTNLRKIGEACLALGHRALARAWYQLALSHDPGNADLQSAIAHIDAAP
jgi:tetratricopeptide (TPR) repeat protein